MIEFDDTGAGFAAMHAVDSVSNVTVRQFLAKHLKPSQTLQIDALPALNAVGEMQNPKP